MAKPLRRRNPRRAVNLSRSSLQRVQRRWIPGSASSAFDLGEVEFVLDLLFAGTYPDTGVTANFDLSLLLAGDIGVTQFFGRALEDSRAPHNPPRDESRA